MISLWVFPRGWCSNGGKSELAEILTIPRSVSSIHQQGTAPTADGGTEAVAVICVTPWRHRKKRSLSHYLVLGVQNPQTLWEGLCGLCVLWTETEVG